MSSIGRTNRLWAIPIIIFIAAFFLAMIYYASLPTVPESYSSIMLQGYPAFITALVVVDIFSRRRLASLTIIVGGLAWLSFYISLPFVNTTWLGLSMGFVLATSAFTAFLSIFFYVAFFSD